jgi:hypothetical protein
MLVFAVVHVIHKIPKIEVLDVPTGEALSLVEQGQGYFSPSWTTSKCSVAKKE